MNALFTLLTVISLIFFLFNSPESFLSCVASSGEKSLLLSFDLLALYMFWLGIIKIAEETGLSAKLSKLLRPITGFLFGNLPPETENALTMSISANMLGIGNAATPLGIKGIRLLEEEGREKAAVVFFVLSSTSIQLIPTTVLSLRASAGSVSPYDVFLPAVLVSTLSTAFGVTVSKLFVK